MVSLHVLEKLRKECNKSFLKFSHAATILDERGNILSLACNYIPHQKIGNKLSIHAEEAAIMKLPKYFKKNMKYKLTLVVIRVHQDGEFRMSKPCQNCQEAINKAKNIKRVIYSYEAGYE